MAPATQKGEAPMPVVHVHEIAGTTREQYEQGMRELRGTEQGDVLEHALQARFEVSTEGVG